MAYDLGTAHGTIEIEYTGAREVDKAAKDMDRAKDSSVDTDKALRRLGATLKGLGKGVVIGGIAVGLTNASVAAASLGIQIAGAVPALASLASLAAGLPALVVGAGVALGVLKAAFAGVGEAAKEAFNTESAAAFEEAIAKLSPAARDFAVALREAAPGLRDLQQGLQESFFRAAGLTGGLQTAITTLEGMRGKLNGVSSQLGLAARQFVAFTQSTATVDFLNAATTRLRNAIANLTPAIGPVLTGLRDVGNVGLPLMDRLSAGVGGVATRFGQWLSDIAADGRLQQWIDQALDTLQQLGAIASNIGSILSSVFGAAQASGGGLLGTIKEITGQFATFLNSAGGQEALTSLFTGILDVAKQLAPVFSTLAGALGGALGPALQQLATGVGPVLLEVVKALSPAFAPLAMAIAQVATAVAPVLPAVAQLVGMLATLGAGVLTTLAANLQPLIGLFGAALTGALTALAPVLGEIVAALPGFATAGLQLAQAMLPLVPAIIQFASALATSLLPHLPQIMASVQQLIPPLVQLATIFADQLASALIAVIPYIPAIVSAMVALQGTITTMLTVGVQFVVLLFRIGSVLADLVGKAASAAAGFASALISKFLSVVAFVQTFPGRIFNAMIALGALLRSIATSAWNALRAVFTAGVNAATNIARSIIGKVRGAISSLTGMLGSLASQAWARLRAAFTAGVNAAQAVARGLPGRIRSALGNLGGLLVSAGADVVRGLVNGMKGAIGSAVAAAADVGRGVINGIKSTLKISSPSKVMVQMGRFVTQGLVDGMLGTAKQVKAASNKLANMVVDAFADKVISRGQRNSVLKTLSRNTKTMLTLVNRANAIAAKLKTAQTALTAVKKQYDDTYAEAVKQTKESFQLVSSGQDFVNLDLTKERFRAAVQQAKDFAADIAALAKRGLNKDLLTQLVTAGAADGGAMADALANADTATIKELNALQASLTTSATAVGKSAADALYGAGVKAAQGLVKGLQSQQKQIEALMLKIAKSMEKAIKKALKIKSPSRLMFDLGQFTAEGLALGIESLVRQVEQAAQKLATATILPTVQLGATRAATAAQSALGGTTVGGTTNVLNQTVNALPGMDAKAVADYGFTKLRLALGSGMSAAPTLAPVPAGA